MNIFDQYGIKEVADVTLYSIHKKTDGSGDVYYVPALYLDTLKISTVEKTAENVWAEGGLGNARLISWDYGKQINVSLEDALCTPASLSLCWNGILSADWKNANVEINTDVCCCRNPLTKISRVEKAFYPRQDSENAVISNLLPKVKSDVVDKNLGLLKISSVVDGTDVRGMGVVRNHTYRWKMAIESAVQSIAVVPDRFFDITGKSYPIDWDRKVSVHSLPTYDNYKQAIIYRINNRPRCIVPPAAKIIFDNAMITEDTEVRMEELTTYRQASYANPISLAELLYDNGYTVYEEGLVKRNNKYYVPVEDFFTQINGIPYIAGESEAIEENILVNGERFNAEDYHTQFTHWTILVSVDSNSNFVPKCRTVMDAKSFTRFRISSRYYGANHTTTDLIPEDENGNVYTQYGTCAIDQGDYLAIVVDNNDNYIPLIGVITPVVSKDNEEENLSISDVENAENSRIENEEKEAINRVLWYTPSTEVDTTQFKGIDMWLRFDSINKLIYFLITKYENDIIKIQAATIQNARGLERKTDEAENGEEKEYFTESWNVNKNATKVIPNEDEEAGKVEGKLWAYINPRTMQPYDDDYWFHQGEPYYIKSLTMAPKDKKLKGNRITVLADQWPGMYMMVGETYIRSRDTGEDERMQIKFPLCKVKSDQTLTLEAEGDPTTFNLELEVARPASGVMMELTAYEIADKLQQGEDGCFYAIDGSSEVLSE